GRRRCVARHRRIAAAPLRQRFHAVHVRKRPPRSGGRALLAGTERRETSTASCAPTAAAAGPAAGRRSARLSPAVIGDNRSMQELRSYVGGRWIAGSGAQQTLLNPTTEEPLAQASSEGVDLKAALDYARSKGGPALRALSFAERGA